MSKARAPKPPPGRTPIKKAYDKAKRKYTEDLRIMKKFEEETPIEYNKTLASRQEEKLMDVVKTATEKWQAFDRARDDLIDETDEEYVEGIEVPDGWYGENNVELMASRSKDLCHVLAKLFTEEDDDDFTKALPVFGAGAMVKFAERKVLKDEVGTTLSNISVNREKLENFKKSLEEQYVDQWEEDSQCQVYTGIERGRYADFLKLFQISNKLDAQTMAGLEIVQYGKGLDKILKSFNCNFSNISGAYGLYCVVPSQLEKDDVPRLDVAFSIFNFKTQLMGSDRIKTKGGQAGLMRKNTNRFPAFVKDVFTGETGGNRRLKVADMNALSESFIIWKALSGFEHAGFIKKIKYEEDNPNYKKDPVKYSEPTITEVP